MKRLVVLWVHLVTAAAPPVPRSRRREEMAAHLSDALEAGATAWGLVGPTLRGAVDDLRWCSEERAHVGLPPLLIGPVGSTVCAGLCMIGTFVAAIGGSPAESELLRTVLPTVAAAVLLASFLYSFWQRWQAQDPGVDDPIFP